MVQWLKLLGFLTVLGLLGVLAFLRVDPDGAIKTDIRELLPEGGVQDDLVTAAHRQLQQSFERQHFFLIEAADETSLFGAAVAFDQALKQSGLYEIETGKSVQGDLEIGEFLFQYRYRLLSVATQKALASDAGQKAFLKESLDKLYRPFSGVSTGLLQSDPLLVSLKILDESTRFNAVRDFSYEKGFLVVAREGRRAILLKRQLIQSPFSTNLQIRISPFLDKMENDITAQWPDIQLTRAGVIEHSYRAAAQARDEIGFIGGLSAIGVVLLTVFVFRTVIPIFGTIFTIILGVYAGAVSVIAVFHSINMVSAIAGASLIGISVDYAFHYFSERAFGEAAGQHDNVLRHIRTGVVMCLGTSLIAFFGMAIPPFPGLREIALFSGAGLATSFLCLWFLFPFLPMKGVRLRAIPFAGVVTDWVEWGRECSSGKSLWILGGISIPLAFVALFLLKPVDDIRALRAIDPDVGAAEEYLTTYSSQRFASQYILVKGETIEDILRREEALRLKLDAVNSQDIGGYIALSQFVPSYMRQTASADALLGLSADETFALREYFKSTGLPTDLKQSFISDLMSAPYLLPQDMIDSKLFPDLDRLLIKMRGQPRASIILLQEPYNPDLIKAEVFGIPNVVFVDPVRNIGDLMRYYRSQVELMVVMAYGIIFLILAWRYGLKPGLFIVLPPTIAALSAIAFLYILQQPYSVFATIGLILILGIGIDYTLFFAEAKNHVEATALAIILSAVSTILAFGLLAFSTTPAVRVFGLTICCGIGVALALSPLARIKRPTS